MREIDLELFVREGWEDEMEEIERRLVRYRWLMLVVVLFLSVSCSEPVPDDPVVLCQRLEKVNMAKGCKSRVPRGTLWKTASSAAIFEDPSSSGGSGLILMYKNRDVYSKVKEAAEAAGMLAGRVFGNDSHLVLVRLENSFSRDIGDKIKAGIGSFWRDATPVSVQSVQEVADAGQSTKGVNSDKVAIDRRGTIEVVDIDSSALGNLKNVLVERYKQASGKNQTILLMLIGSRCPACKAVDAALTDPLMQGALKNVQIVRVNMRTFRDELAALEMRPKVMPVFVLLRDDATAEDAIHGGEWDEDIAKNIAPVLGSFVHGRYQDRRDKSWTLSGVPSQPAVADLEADYQSLDDIRMDGAKAKGKTALLRVWRGNTEAKSFTAHSCGGAGGIAWVKLEFGQEHRDLVRAIPTSSRDCVRVHFRVTGRERFSKNIRGEVLAVLDVEPQVTQEAPEGVDFVSMDDINMAGKAARGKIGLLEVWRGNTDDRGFTAHPCGEQGGIQFMKIHYSSDQREAVRELPTSSRDGCRSIRFKLRGRSRFGNTWDAELLEIR